MTLVPIGLAITLSYIPVAYLFGYFFEYLPVRFSKRSLYSMFITGCLFALVAGVVFAVPDKELGNRIQHAFGGGFLAFFVCWRVAQDAELKIGRFKFVVFTALLVTTLGVCNELAEFFLQANFYIISAATVTDTWFDLASNTGGLFVAAVCFLPFMPGKRS